MDDNQLITMTKKEAKRYEVIKDLLAKKIDGSEAAKQLNLSVRQIKRIKVRVRKLKMKGVIHGNRGQASNRQTAAAITQKVKKLLREKYSDFNPLLAQEHLSDDDNISKSKETIRQWMMAEKLWQPKKKSRARKFSWRERKDNYGEMQQFDGSYHSWFEGRNPEAVGEEQCLLLAVDDATGAITEANRFLREVFIPKFNAQFSVVPKKKNDLHRKLSEQQKNELVKILSIQSTRRVNNDYTVRFKNNYYQLQEIQPTTVVKQDLVTIEEHLNGELKIALRGQYLDYVQLPDRPKKEIDIKLIALSRTKTAWIPPANHPWRNQIFTKQKQPILTAV